MWKWINNKWIKAGIIFVIIAILQNIIDRIINFSGDFFLPTIIGITISDIFLITGIVLLIILIILIYKLMPKEQINELIEDKIYGTNVGDINKHIHHFNRQSELPAVNRVLECAKQKIDILTWTAEKITTQHIDSIRNAINRNILVTIMLLAPDSEIAKKGDIVYNSVNLPDRIQNSLNILCDLKNKLGDKKHNLLIRIYDADNNRSMIVLDSMSNDAWIQVTHYVKGVDASTRYSDSTYKKENEQFFNQHFNDFSILLKESVEYKCD